MSNFDDSKFNKILKMANFFHILINVNITEQLNFICY